MILFHRIQLGNKQKTHDDITLFEDFNKYDEFKCEFPLTIETATSYNPVDNRQTTAENYNNPLGFLKYSGGISDIYFKYNFSHQITFM